MQVYGLTESNGVGSLTVTYEERKHYRTTGLITTHVEAKLVDTTTEKYMPPNHKG